MLLCFGCGKSLDPRLSVRPVGGSGLYHPACAKHAERLKLEAWGEALWKMKPWVPYDSVDCGGGDKVVDPQTESADLKESSPAEKPEAKSILVEYSRMHSTKKAVGRSESQGCQSEESTEASSSVQPPMVAPQENTPREFRPSPRGFSPRQNARTSPRGKMSPRGSSDMPLRLRGAERIHEVDELEAKLARMEAELTKCKSEHLIKAVIDSDSKKPADEQTSSPLTCQQALEEDLRRMKWEEESQTAFLRATEPEKFEAFQSAKRKLQFEQEVKKVTEAAVKEVETVEVLTLEMLASSSQPSLFQPDARQQGSKAKHKEPRPKVQTAGASIRVEPRAQMGGSIGVEARTQKTASKTVSSPRAQASGASVRVEAPCQKTASRPASPRQLHSQPLSARSSPKTSTPLTSRTVPVPASSPRQPLSARSSKRNVSAPSARSVPVPTSIGSMWNSSRPSKQTQQQVSASTEHNRQGRTLQRRCP